jgi:hypothetical protein
MSATETIDPIIIRIPLVIEIPISVRSSRASGDSLDAINLTLEDPSAGDSSNQVGRPPSVGHPRHKPTSGTSRSTPMISLDGAEPVTIDAAAAALGVTRKNLYDAIARGSTEYKGHQVKRTDKSGSQPVTPPKHRPRRARSFYSVDGQGRHSAKEAGAIIGVTGSAVVHAAKVSGMCKGHAVKRLEPGEPATEGE